VLEDNGKHNRKTSDAGVIIGPIWVIGWMFTIGFLKLSVGKATLGLIIWPYLLGSALH